MTRAISHTPGWDRLLRRRRAPRDPFPQQALLRRILGQPQGVQVGTPRLVGPAQPLQQLAARRVIQVVAGQAIGQWLDALPMAANSGDIYAMR